MNTHEQAKLLRAGFTIVQGEENASTGLLIKQKTASRQSWHTREKDFPTKAALKRRLIELMKDEKIIDLIDSKNHF
jgi:hypothetical protein